MLFGFSDHHEIAVCLLASKPCILVCLSACLRLNRTAYIPIQFLERRHCSMGNQYTKLFFIGYRTGWQRPITSIYRKEIERSRIPSPFAPGLESKRTICCFVALSFSVELFIRHQPKTLPLHAHAMCAPQGLCHRRYLSAELEQILGSETRKGSFH